MIVDAENMSKVEIRGNGIAIGNKHHWENTDSQTFKGKRVKR